LMAESMRRREPDASEEALNRERAKAMRAPVIVVVAAKVAKGHKIPEIEQIAAVSAAAQSIMRRHRPRGMALCGRPASRPMIRSCARLWGWMGRTRSLGSCISGHG